MKKIALAIASLAIAAAPVLACPHMDAEKSEETAPRTAEKDKAKEAPKAKDGDKAKEAGIWPPSVAAEKRGGKSIPYVAQENKIVMPSKFSPVQ